MDDLRFRLNFNLSEKNEIYHHSQQERLGISNIAKYGKYSNTENIALQSWQICILLYYVRELVTKLVTNFRT